MLGKGASIERRAVNKYEDQQIFNSEPLVEGMEEEDDSVNYIASECQ